MRREGRGGALGTRRIVGADTGGRWWREDVSRHPRPEIGISIIVPVHNNPGDHAGCRDHRRRRRLHGRYAVRRCSHRMPVVALAENSGPAAARNEGAGRARGAILFFVDADVVIAPRAIERVQDTHLKRWTLGSIVRTDIARRALPWSRLSLESGHAPHHLDRTTEHRVSAALVGLAAATAPLGVLRLELLGLPAAAVLAVAIFNRSLCTFFRR